MQLDPNLEVSPSEDKAAGEQMFSIGLDLEKLGDSDIQQFDS